MSQQQVSQGQVAPQRESREPHKPDSRSGRPEGERRRSGRFSLPRVWRTSLQFRTVVSTVLVTVLLLGVAGFVLMQRVSTGLMEAKQRQALAEAAAGRSIARSAAAASLESDPARIMDDLIEDLGQRAGKPPSFEVLVGPAPGSEHLPEASTNLVSQDSIPPDLRQAVRDSDSQVWMYHDIAYSDGRVEPGLIVGAPVVVRNIGSYELFYFFSLQDVLRTINVVRSAVIAVGVALVVTLAVLAWWFSRRLVRPVQQAARTASALAKGDLSRRLDVGGEDDMARLAQSFNTMADSLEDQIVRLRQLSEMQRRFVADVSHELRTPLTTIRMAADVISEKSESLPVETQRTAELLVGEVERFDVLLSELLEVSRFDAGEVVIDVEEVDLPVLVREWVRALKPLAVENRCALDVEGPASCTVLCDPGRIAGIVRNLVVNAIEYGAGEPIRVVVECGASDVQVHVADNGVGLSPQDADHVFERFWRADPSRARTLGGTGLGLAISRDAARMHGGDLTVEAELGRGCVFTLWLPRG